MDQAQVNFPKDRIFFLMANFPSSKFRMSQEIQLVRTAYGERGPGTAGPNLLLPVICTLLSTPLFSWFLPLALFLLQKVLKVLLSNFFISPATRSISAGSLLALVRDLFVYVFNRNKWHVGFTGHHAPRCVLQEAKSDSIVTLRYS